MTPRPPFKFPGGKRRLVPELTPPILDWLRSSPGARYFEPFLGSGAVFFGLRAAGWTGMAILSDLNPRIPAVFRQVRDNVELVAAGLRQVFARYAALPAEVARAEFYYEVREFDGTSDDEQAEAVRFLFLNLTAYNGLVRYNREGRFNSPHGRTASGKLPDVERRIAKIRTASAALTYTQVEAADYRAVLQASQPGDVAYLDPPFPTDFTAFTADGFNEKDQTAVRDTARELVGGGVRIVLSNLDCPLIRDLYPEDRWHVRRVEVRHSINRNGEGRKPVGELIITAR